MSKKRSFFETLMFVVLDMPKTFASFLYQGEMSLIEIQHNTKPMLNRMPNNKDEVCVMLHKINLGIIVFDPTLMGVVKESHPIHRLDMIKEKANARG